MPDNKNQHYVPRCHLKPFTLGMDDKAINLFHIKSKRLIEKAPVKSQCARDYFYGEDLILEKGFQSLEGEYASILRRIFDSDSVDDAAGGFLRDFSYLQYLRTEIAIRRGLIAQTEMADLIFESSQDERPPDFTRKEFIQLVMNTFADSVSDISDLKVCILRNETNTPFVTSDDPAVMINRFYSQRLSARWRAAGIRNAGIMFVLPLSPKFLAFSYDGDVYTCDGRINGIVPTEKTSDVEALNLLQFMKASESIYFANWADGGKIRVAFEAAVHKRPAAWHKLHFPVKDEAAPEAESTRYRVVHTASERQNATEALIHLEQPLPDPGVWCSKIKFRAKPIYIDTRSGAGYRRRTVN